MVQKWYKNDALKVQNSKMVQKWCKNDALIVGKNSPAWRQIKFISFFVSQYHLALFKITGQVIKF